MNFDFHNTRLRLACVFLALFLSACGVEINEKQPQDEQPQDNGQSLEIGAAQTATLKTRRVAIVHSQSSKSNFYDPFAYNQLFAAMQHQAMMAGIPFDLLDEDQLAFSADLLGYDTIIIPQLSHVKRLNRELIVARLLEAQENGIGIITSGEFLGSRADGTSFDDFTSAMVSVLGVQPVEYLNGIKASITVANNTHPATNSYDPEEELQSYEEIWFGNFAPVSGEQSTVLTLIESGDETYTGAQIIERAGRVVHFANEQVMADNNLLWRVLQWITYGEIAPVSLQVSRADHVFLARNDMDQAMIAAELIRTEIPLLNIIRDWKEDYNFVGSYYLDIGNDPSIGQYTDWSISGPLYQNYIELGNEIGTHSWTHPHYTSLLTAEELEFEFKDSAAEIGSQVGVPVIGAAVPGNSESLEVVETLNPWLDYLSGRTGAIGSGYLGATGYLEPQHDMMYFSLNMSPDFTLIDFLRNTPAESTRIWKQELDDLLEHSQQPLVHWLWHDYGPTTQTDAGLYSKEMFSETIAYANSLGGEFATLEDIHNRINTFADVDFQVGSGGIVTANVNATDVGQFSLKIAEDAKIDSVENWYAYSDNRVFLPDTGGEFSISLTTPDAAATPVTRITSLPMRARLMSLTGDGDQLNFTFYGEGEVEIALSNAMQQNASVSGADSFVEKRKVLTLQFNEIDTHIVELTPAVALNQAPVARDVSVSTSTAISTTVTLSGSDTDGDTLSYKLESKPQYGDLTGTAPNLSYTSDPGYTGDDTFTYSVNDGTTDGNTATVEITVTRSPSLNTPPIANELILETLINQPQVFQLSASDKENQALTYRVTTPPEHGFLTGTAPNLTYTPLARFIGTDKIEFVANDSISDSETGSVTFNVDSRVATTPSGTVSNATTEITIDGDLSEWSGLTDFGTDPQDITGANNQIDWRRATMAHDDTNFYIAYTEFGDADLTWGNQIYIDTDSDSSTGFRGFSNDFPIGADVLIEGNVLFYYTGIVEQNDWLWQIDDSLDATADGNNVEISIPRRKLNNPENMLLFFYGNSAATRGTAIDFFPDNANDTTAVFRSRQFSYSVTPNNTPDNQTPIAFAQSIKLTEGTSYPLTLTGFDPDGDPLEYFVGTPVFFSGTLTGTAPNLVYTPAADTRQDLVTFQVGDGVSISEARSVQFFIEAAPSVNNTPSANNQSVDVLSGAAIPVTLSGTDADGDALTYRITRQPDAGVITGSAPNLTYKAPATPGTDSFSFVTNDGTTDSNPATVTVIVKAQPQPNNSPQAQSQSVTTNFETALGITLLATDGDSDPLTYRVTSQPSLGSLTGTAPELTYVPFADATGTDSFTFRVNDGTVDSAVGNVSITILPSAPVNTPPTAQGQSLTTASSQPLDITLIATDLEQTQLFYTVVTRPQGGVLTGTAPNLRYTPNSGFSGVDSFKFRVSDGDNSTSNKTVTINVSAATDGVVSNPVDSITIDGSLDDWSGLQALGTDPADIHGDAVKNPLDWRDAWVAHSATDLYIAYKNHSDFTLSWGHGIYIDTDNDINTGFRGFSGEYPIGADILIEFNSVQSYTGSGEDWAWTDSGQAELMKSDETAELAVPLSALTATGTLPESLRFYLRADNAAFEGNTIDHFPNDAVHADADPALRSMSYRLTP